MKVLSAILLLILTTVFFQKTQISSNNELRFKNWLVDTLPQVTVSFEIQDDSLTFITKEHHFYEIRNGRAEEAMATVITSLLKEYSEPPFRDYDLEVVKETHFTSSELPTLIYDVWSEYPLIKVTHKDISISYEEVRGRINRASIINHSTNDTTFVQWLYDKGKIKKQVLDLK